MCLVLELEGLILYLKALAREFKTKTLRLILALSLTGQLQNLVKLLSLYILVYCYVEYSNSTFFIGLLIGLGEHTFSVL